MKVIGIVGGVASGKSFVAQCLEKLGAEHLDADRFGHEVLLEPEVKSLARNRWGDGVFDRTGEIDRTKLAKIVFGEGIDASRERNYLERLTHPRIRHKLQARMEAAKAAGTPAVVLDAALLLEGNWSEFCDLILFVDASDELRRRRAGERGWTDAEWQSRERSQTPLGEKRVKSDHSIDNNGTAAETHQQVRAFWDSLLAADLSN